MLLLWSGHPQPWKSPAPLAHTIHSPCLDTLSPLRSATLTGLGLATTGTGSGTGMAQGLGAVRLNSLGSVTLALAFGRGG